MKKQTLLLFSLLFFTGCAERGYIVTSNIATQTVTAERITSIKPDNITKNKPNVLDDMLKDVKKTLKKQKPKLKRSKPKKSKQIKRTTKKNNLQETKSIKQTTQIQNVKVKKEVKPINTTRINKNKDFDEENLLLEAARKSRELRKAKLREAFELKEAARIKSKKTEEKLLSIQKSEEAKLSLLKEQQDNKAAKELEAKMAKDKEARRLAQIQKAKELQEQKTLEKKALEEAQRKEAEKQRLLEKENKEKVVDSTPVYSSNKLLETTETLKFNPINKVYHKFGTSEVHGRVIYLNNAGQEIRLGQTKIYLLPVSAKLNHWYSNYYLKNKSKSNNTIVNYLNKTSLNAEKKFEFFGVPEGSYYVIIESNYPSNINKKVYIAKKIKVGKYKKVMGVFSKKL